MELRHLRYFAAVAEELHFGRAAAKLNIAQPALSLQINALEKELGVKLVERSTRRVELSEAGRVFQERALSILNAVHAACQQTQLVAGKEVTALSIGTIYPAIFSLLPEFMARIDRRFPGIRISIKSDTTDNIIRDIERGNTNIGFVRPIENISSLRYFNLTSEDYFLAVAKSNPLSRKAEIEIDDLKDQKIIGFRRSNLTYTEKYFKDVFERHGIEGNVAFQCSDTLSLISLVASGIGVGFVPAWASHLPNSRFRLREVKGIQLQISMGVAWNKDDPVANKDDLVEIAQSFKNWTAG